MFDKKFKKGMSSLLVMASHILALALVLTLAFVSETFAATKCPTGQNCTKCGDDCFAYLTDDNSVGGMKQLNIIGTGAMSDYVWNISASNYYDAQNNINIAYLNRSVITSVKVGEGITSIGNFGLDVLEQVKSLSLPNTLNTLGWWAFGRMSKLTGTLIIPDSVTTIRKKAFFSMSGLSGIVIPDSWADNQNLNFDDEVFLDFPTNVKVFCKGKVEKCREALLKFKPVSEGGTCSEGCISSSRIEAVSDKSQCTGNNYVWDETTKQCLSCLNSGKVIYKGECLDEYPFSRKYWTPSEAAKYLNDDDNDVILTFKK